MVPQTLTELALELGCSAVLTGHTATDRAETLLVNLVRGAGADGMQVRSIDLWEDTWVSEWHAGRDHR